jgi:hypothetical protein
MDLKAPATQDEELESQSSGEELNSPDDTIDDSDDSTEDDEENDDDAD